MPKWGKGVYAEKLRDPRWQRKRLEIMQRDDFTCQKCGDSKSPLNVHHKRYIEGDPWDSPDSDLVTFCETCHDAVSAFDGSPRTEPNLSRLGEDAIHEAFHEYGVASPSPSVLAKCRAVASEPAILRVVNRLAWEGKLKRYAARPAAFVAVIGMHPARPESPK